MSLSFCAFGDDCSVFDAQHNLPGICYSRQVCEGCLRAGESTLNLLRYDYVDLSQIIPKPTVQSDVLIFRPKPESSPPIMMAAWALRSEIAHLVRTAERELRHARGDLHSYGQVPVREGYALDSAIGYLRPRMDMLADLPATSAQWCTDDLLKSEWDGTQVILGFGSLHRRSRTMCGLDDRTIFMPGACLNCAVNALRRSESSSEDIWCAHCKARFTGSEYLLSLVGPLVQDQR